MIQRENNKIFSVCFAFLFSVCFALPLTGQAAELFFEPREINTTVNHTEEVEIFLNTGDSENINALEINVEYPSEFLKLKDWSNGNSIINLWIKEPENNNETFSFQGIIPGGYSEKGGLLMTLYFEGIKEGLAEIKIKNNSQILLNDGLGTPTENSFLPAIINIKFSEKEPPKLEFTEKTPPEPFTPIISHSDEIYDGNYFLVFSTQDKNSGIDYYEISEGEEPFIIAQSPYLLRNQRLDEDIKIRAVDKAGNIRMEIIPVEKTEGKNKFKEALFFSILLPLIIILVIFAKYLYNRIRKRT
jgi:hypothetical protein